MPGAMPATAFLYECRVRHVRAAPLRHSFSYRTYQWLADVDDLPRLPRGLRLLADFRRPTTWVTRGTPSGRTWTGSWLRAASTWPGAGSRCSRTRACSATCSTR